MKKKPLSFGVGLALTTLAFLACNFSMIGSSWVRPQKVIKVQMPPAITIVGILVLGATILVIELRFRSPKTP